MFKNNNKLNTVVMIYCNILYYFYFSAF